MPSECPGFPNHRPAKSQCCRTKPQSLRPEVADQLGVSDRTVYNWIREKRISALKIGRPLRIRQSELERFVAANSTTAADDQPEFCDPDAQAFQTPGRHLAMRASEPEPRERAAQRLLEAKSAWAQTMTGHKMAPPDADFSSRLRTLALAPQAGRHACEEADRAGLLWRPIPGAQGAQPLYELRTGTGRRGPAELWDRFDAAVQTLNHAITGTNVVGVARAFGELSSAAAALADAVDAEEQEPAAKEVRWQAVQPLAPEVPFAPCIKPRHGFGTARSNSATSPQGAVKTL